MSHRSHSHRHKNHHDDRQRSSASVISSQHYPLSSDALFVIDRKGDVQNLRYGSIDKYKVPKYRTAGYGRLIGLDRRHRIISTSETERDVDNEALDTNTKTKVLASRLQRRPKEEVGGPVKPEVRSDNEFAQQQNYVAFGRKKRRLTFNSSADNQVSAHTDSNLSDHSQSASDLDLVSSDEEVLKAQNDEDAFDAFKNHPDNKKLIELRTLTDTDPQNLEAWLALIAHQERYYALSTGQDQALLDLSQRRAVTDMKVSLYEKAHASVKDPKAREKLTLGLMKEGSNIWDTNKQLQQWKSVLTSSTSPELWYAYLNFQQTNAVTFSYEQCLEIYSQVLLLTRNLQAENHDYHCIYLILRLTKFMYEAGFSERAVAIWQALIEYNLLSMDDTKCNTSDFEAFWESECPRVGEEGAKGWQSVGESEIPTRIDDHLQKLSPTQLWSDWEQSETIRCQVDKMPARTLDDTVEDDPYRVILFSDIKEYIFRLKSVHGPTLLQQGFLVFCGLPSLPVLNNPARSWWTDPFLCGFGINMNVAVDNKALFAPSDSPSYIWRPSEHGKTIDRDFVIRVLNLLIANPLFSAHLIEYVIALQLHTDQAMARKLCKRLLKTHSSNLLLYNTFALVEARSGKIGSANNVWMIALSMSSTLELEVQQQRLVLCYSWIRQLMMQNAYAHALCLTTEIVPATNITMDLLQNAAAAHDISYVQRLRAEAYYREEIANNLTTNHERLVNHVAVYAIMKYLQNDNSLENALQVYHSAFLLLEKQGSRNTIERFHQDQTWLAHFHAVNSTSGYQPKQILAAIEESALAFPNNSLFSKLHDRYLRQAGIVEKFRIINHNERDEASTIMPVLYNIAKELSRPLYAGSTVHSIRRAFSNAVMAESEARRSVALWLEWIKWELSIDSPSEDGKGKQAKEVYLSALRNCPWAKTLYLEGFRNGLLSRAMGEKELFRVYHTMIERGLRIRHDISEVLEERGQRRE